LQLSGKIYPIIIFIAMLFMSQTEIEKPVKINSYFGFYDKAENAVLKIALRDLWSRVGIDYNDIRNGIPESCNLYKKNISQVEATKYALQYAFDSDLSVFETMRLLIRFNL